MTHTLTKEDCNCILTKIYPDNTPQLLNFELKLAPKEQDGFFGDSHLLIISYSINNKIESKTFFVKIFPVLPDNAKMAVHLLAYEKEIFFYKFLIPEYNKFGIKTNFVPECYFFKDDKIIVMEDLNIKNYGIKRGFSLDETKSGLKSIAEMHAASILYEDSMCIDDLDFDFADKHSDILLEKFYDFSNTKSFVYNHFKEGFKCIKNLLEYLPQIEHCKEEFLKNLEKCNWDEIFNTDLGYSKVLSHGDLWSRNILFQEKTNDCKIIDFQMIRYFYPAFDVLSYLYNTYPTNKLKNHRDELLKYYYECLFDCTNSSVEKILPYVDFMKSVDHFEVLTIYQAAVGNSLNISGNLNNMFFGNRVKYCCQEFKNNKQYRDTLTCLIICLINYILKTNFHY